MNKEYTSPMKFRGHLERASADKLQEVFENYASVEVRGEKYMNKDDFVLRYLQLENYKDEAKKLIIDMVDTNKDGLISFAEFQAFEGMLCVPDALYKTAFQLFDTNGTGFVTFEQFSDLIKRTDLVKRTAYKPDGDFAKLYFGSDRRRRINYVEFSQFIHDFHEECAVQAFRKYDKNGTGYISVMDFQEIMVNLRGHLLTSEIKKNLTTVAGGIVSFPYFMAFNSLLNHMDLVKRTYLTATGQRRTQQLTKQEFLYSAQMVSQITPLEVEILYKLSDTIHATGRLVYNDLNIIAPDSVCKRTSDSLGLVDVDDRAIGTSASEVLLRFILASISGVVGSTAVYPIDLVKTRLQNQRSIAGQMMYKNGIDCFKQVIQKEGIFGLYTGLLPQLVGIAPEKALKLTVNDFSRGKFMQYYGYLPLHAEILAGASAGMCQVVLTNPLEIIKIRLQVAGEVKDSKLKAWTVIKELGLTGLYKGARACITRDVIFSSIYFPSYSHVKASLADENGYNNPFTLLCSGFLAGVPAASLATPADVVKTRLQVTPRPGQTVYKGMFDAILKIYAEEGFKAFWKGALARVLRSSPQFGVTLFTYEILQRMFLVDYSGPPPSSSDISMLSYPHHGNRRSPDLIGGYEVARSIFSGLETKFGLSLPKFPV